MPPTQSRISDAGNTCPRQEPYPVWLENCTVFTAQTSAPSRCKGNTALALPTWPKATQDWMERMFTPCSRPWRS